MLVPIEFPVLNQSWLILSGTVKWKRDKKTNKQKTTEAFGQEADVLWGDL